MKTKKTVLLILVVFGLVLLGLSACGNAGTNGDSPAKAETESKTDETAAAKPADPASDLGQSDEKQEAPETEAPTTTAEPEPVKAPEYLAPAKPADPGHFSDADAFLGFDTYKGTYINNTKTDFSDSEVTLGVTVLKDHYSGEFGWSQQYADESHEAAHNPEKLDAGAVGFVEPNWFGRTGDNPRYIVYNPSDAPAAFEECLIIGFENEMAVFLEFSNDIRLLTANMEGNVTNTDPRDAFIAILGEPYEISGETSADSLDAIYYWRDESGKHVFKAHFWGWNGRFQTIGESYMNFAIIDQ